MRRLLACLLVVMSAATWASGGWAQQLEAAGPPGAAEFAQLYARWQQTQDPEDKIALGEQLLARESALKEWPLPQVRERVKGELLLDIGYAYVERRQGSAADNVEHAIAHLEAALTVFTRETFPGDWALTRHSLGSVYWGRIRGERAENVEKAIAHLEAALEVRTREANAQDWAQTQNSLGLAYSQRVRGEPAENLEKAIAAHQRALTVFTRDAFPQAWAANQIGLGFAYANRIYGDRAENQEGSIAHHEAALAVFTRQAFPREWALAQISLGKAYADRTRGERADNLEKAIAHNEAVLTAFTRDTSPREWAQTKSSLGLAYQQRLRGERADNLEKAIAAYEEALSVMTREGFPHEWATTQNNLGHAYSNRIRGERGDNVERAIASYEAALTVRTREAFPQDWAGTQSQLAGAYLGRVHGQEANNLESAIAAAEAALTVYTRQAYPRDWAWAQNTLGIALWRRSLGNPAEKENQEKAIAAAEAALTIFTREASPQGWAVLQHLLGLAYANRPLGEQADNLQRAVAHLDAALTFYTRQAFPRERLRAATTLGDAHTKAGDWRKAGLAYADARDTLLMLLGEGAGEAEARALVADTRFLFPAAAFAAAQRGEGEAALALANEGRARLLATALKLQTLDLPADRRHRLDELRAAIRTGESAMETAQGAERAAAVDKLTALRGELLAIVKGAGTSASGSASVVAQARALAGAAGAVVVPILTKDGGKILIVTSSPSLAVLDLPGLTTDRLDRLLRGDHRDGQPGGWLGAYNINYLKPGEQDSRWPEWIAAIEALGPELWRLFGATLDAALKEGGVRIGARLIWMPTDALGILPLGLVQDPASKRRLADTYEIVYAPSLAALSTAQAQIAKGAAATLAAIVNPTGDLAGTEKEGALIASYFTRRARTLLERSAATPEAVLGALKGRTHWHFASHGSFSWEDARASALVMHNFAPLSVGRLLETDGLGRPRLVVLSACETGLYDIDRNPDEFVGLPGAFTALGAAGVVGTLWPVSDAATALLMAKLYELHMGAKMSPSEALWRAQLWLRQATNADLQAYARLAAKGGRMGTRHVAEIERELSEEGLTRSRNASAIEWIAPDAARAAVKNKKTSDAVNRLARPYAHPYFWGGFVYTGL